MVNFNKIYLLFLFYIMLYMKDWAVSSAGEHHVDIVGVTGSIPVPPTIKYEGFIWNISQY